MIDSCSFVCLFVRLSTQHKQKPISFQAFFQPTAVKTVLFQFKKCFILVEWTT